MGGTGTGRGSGGGDRQVALFCVARPPGGAVAALCTGGAMLSPLCSPEIFKLFQRRCFDLAAVDGRWGGGRGRGLAMRGLGDGEELQQEQEVAHLRADTPTSVGEGSGPSWRQRNLTDLAPPTFTDGEKKAGPSGGLLGGDHLIGSQVTAACTATALTPPTAC